MRKNIWPSKRKWHVEDLHQSRVDGGVHRSRYDFRDQKRKTVMVSTCGNNVREQNCILSVFKNIPEGKRTSGKRRTKWLDDVESDVKKVSVRSWRK